MSSCIFSGLDAELYYVRDDVVNNYALSFILPIPSETNSLHFTWHSKSKVCAGHQNLVTQIYPQLFRLYSNYVLKCILVSILQ